MALSVGVVGSTLGTGVAVALVVGTGEEVAVLVGLGAGDEAVGAGAGSDGKGAEVGAVVSTGCVGAGEGATTLLPVGAVEHAVVLLLGAVPGVHSAALAALTPLNMINPAAGSTDIAPRALRRVFNFLTRISWDNDIVRIQV